jgi:hypothetical protein
MSTQTQIFSENRHLETINRKRKHFKYYCKLFNCTQKFYFNIIILANSETEMKRKIKAKYPIENMIKLINYVEHVNK